MTTPAPQNEAPLESVTDPVCGRVLEAAHAAQVYELRDQRYYFDSAECLQKFIEDPEKYIEVPDQEPDED